MRDFTFNCEGKKIIGSEYVKSLLSSLQASSNYLQLVNHPDTSLDTNLLVSTLKSHQHTLFLFSRYLKLKHDYSYNHYVENQSHNNIKLLRQ